MNYTEKELVKLIADVEQQFTTHLAKAEEDFKASLVKAEGAGAPLVKAEDSQPAPEKKDDKAEKPAEKESKEEPPKEAKSDAPAEGKEPSKEAPSQEAKPEGEAPAAAASQTCQPGEEGCDYDEEDHAHMQKMYASMSRGELKAHHDAVKRALDGQSEAAAPAQAAPAASQPMEKCGDMSMNKTETQAPVEVKPETIAVKQENPDLTLLKSEFEAQKAKAEGLQKNLDAVTEFLTKLVKKTAPAGKAITEMNAIAKSEPVQADEQALSKSEVTAKLDKKASEATLSKSDRDAINAYYLSGASFNTISHLLK